VTSDLSQVANVFVHSAQSGRMGVMVASRGYLQTADNGDRYLVLVNGRRYEGTPGQADYRIVNFARYAVRVEQKDTKDFFPTQKSRPTLELMEDPTPINQAEMSWRVGVPVSTLLLAMLAIPLSAVNPRTGRFFNVIIAVLLYMVYNNLINIVQAWVSDTKLSLLTGVISVHVTMVLVLLVLVGHRLHWFAFLRRR
jgi:lipopolysaccharide export system permease protein